MCAAEVDRYLSGGKTRLPDDGGIKKRVFIAPSSTLTNGGTVQVEA